MFACGCGRQQQIGNRKVPKPGELTAGASHEKMLQELAGIAQRVADENIFVGDRTARSLRQQKAQLGNAAPLLARWLKTYQLAKAELHLGNVAESLDLYRAAESLIAARPEQVKPEILRQFYFDQAVAELRRGETENCCRRQLPQACIVPIRGEAIHQHPEGSQNAIRWLGMVLERSKPDEPMHLAARWLLNVAYMTLGQYPGAVPPEYLIPGLSEADTQELAWKNVAAQRGVATFSLAGGAVADDFDRDGHIDLVVSSSDPRTPLQVFWNQGDGSFVDGSTSAQVQGVLGGLNLVHADYNNDGWLDVLVLRGGWLGAAGRHPNSLLKNNGDRTFTDVTYQAGIALQDHPTQTAAWADYDLDGDLDLYVGNEHAPEVDAPSQLFRNEGDGTFRDVTQAAGVGNHRFAKAVAWADIDGDRDPDLYVSNYRAANRLYENQGDGTFVDRAADWGVDGPNASFPTWFCDVDQDGRPELFVAGYAGGIAEHAAALLGKPYAAEEALPRLYFRQPDGHWQNRASTWGLVDPLHPMGANFADLTNDGNLDIYFGTGWPEYHELMPNRLYYQRNGAFADVTLGARVGHLQKGHAVAMADFDGDGDLDIFEQMGGFVPGDKFYDVLFDNPHHGEHWLSVEVEGRTSNRCGLGAQIRVITPARSLYRSVGTGGSFGGNPFRQHFGLGAYAGPVTVEVSWPQTGRTQRIEIPVTSRVVRVIEEVDQADAP